MTRCKFRCEKVIHSSSGGEVVLVPVTATNPENSSFFKWTPYGEFRMGLLSPETLSQFVPGLEYYIDITPAN